MKTLVAFLLAGAVAALFGGCSSPKKIERAKRIRHFQQLESQASTVIVDTSDGVSKVEAYKVALDYFKSRKSACGAVGLPQEEEALWRVPIFHGVAGLHTEDVIVSKRDGSRTICSSSPAQR